MSLALWRRKYKPGYTPTTSHPSEIQLPPIHIAPCSTPYHEAYNYHPATPRPLRTPETARSATPNQPNNLATKSLPSQTPYHDQTKTNQRANHPHTAKHPRTKKANPVKSWLFLVLLSQSLNWIDSPSPSIETSSSSAAFPSSSVCFRARP